MYRFDGAVSIYRGCFIEPTPFQLLQGDKELEFYVNNHIFLLCKFLCNREYTEKHQEDS